MNYYADKDSGKYLFGTDGPAPKNSMVVPAPTNIHDIWNGEQWNTPKSVLVASAKTKLNSDFADTMAKLHEGWPDYEIQTWTVQNDEAREWMVAPADSKPTTPLLSGMHATRTALGWPEPFEDFVGRVIKNSDRYTAAVAALLAVRHVSERAIEQAEDPTSVEWSFEP